MRRVVVSEFLSLDGVMENPHWAFPFGTEEQHKYKLDELKAADALLLGRVTYDGLAAAWPHMPKQAGEYGKMMNDYPKYVVSTTLEKVEWNRSRLIKGPIEEEILQLKRQPGRDILVLGSGSLVHVLTELDLVDEYRLMIFPVILGKGKRLFADGFSGKRLKWAETRTFPAGVVLHTYLAALD